MSDARRRGRECVSCRAVSERGLCVVRGPRFIIYPTAPAFDETSMVLQGEAEEDKAYVLFGPHETISRQKAQAVRCRPWRRRSLAMASTRWATCPSRCRVQTLVTSKPWRKTTRRRRLCVQSTTTPAAASRAARKVSAAWDHAASATGAEPELIKDTIEGCHARAHTLGERSRQQRERLRLQRESRAAQWQEHGRQLTMEHTQLRERLRK